MSTNFQVAKALQLWRVRQALLLGCVGVSLLIVSLFMSARLPSFDFWNNRADSVVVSIGAYHAVIALAAAVFPLTLRDPSGTLSPFCFGSLCYCVAIVVSWYPVFFRSGGTTVAIGRVLGLGLLFPSFLVAESYGRGGGLLGVRGGVGGCLWAGGCILILIGVWLTPPRVTGEPACAFTVCWRAWNPVSIFNEA